MLSSLQPNSLSFVIPHLGKEPRTATTYDIYIFTVVFHILRKSLTVKIAIIWINQKYTLVSNTYIYLVSFFFSNVQ